MEIQLGPSETAETARAAAGSKWATGWVSLDANYAPMVSNMCFCVFICTWDTLAFHSGLHVHIWFLGKGRFGADRLTCGGLETGHFNFTTNRLRWRLHGCLKWGPIKCRKRYKFIAAWPIYATKGHQINTGEFEEQMSYFFTQFNPTLKIKE